MPVWEARFKDKFDDALWPLVTSFPFDRKIVRHELWASAAHVVQLHQLKAIPAKSAKAILREMLVLMEEQTSIDELLRAGEEDIQTCLENYLTEKLGKNEAGYISLGKSRNSQINVVTRLAFRDSLFSIAEELSGLLNILINDAAAYADVPMAGYTHVQPAQPISLGFWIAGFCEALNRCLKRTCFEIEMINVNTNPAGAVAGTSFQLESGNTNKYLGFTAKSRNALDAVSSQDFNIGVVCLVVQISNILSKLCGEIIHFSAPAYNYIIIPDKFGMGSSYMPQKKNPTLLELIRAKCSKSYGDLVCLLSSNHGLEMGYNRDFQIFKEKGIEAAEELKMLLHGVRLFWENAEFNTDALKKNADNIMIFMAEIANLLSTKSDLSFREAYSHIGRIVSGHEKNDYAVILDELKKLFAAQNVPAEDIDLLDSAATARGHLNFYRSENSAGRDIVLKNIAELKNESDSCYGRIKDERDRIHSCYELLKADIRHLGGI